MDILIRNKRQSLFLIICLISMASCRKMIEIDQPIDLQTSTQVYNSPGSASAVLTGIYTDMSANGIFNGGSSISRFLSLSADELTSVASQSELPYIIYSNNITNEGSSIPFWRSLYSFIFRANGAIEGIIASEKLPLNIKKQLLGEAKFLRALMYFYLVNIYGDVPLLTSTDVEINSLAPRTDKKVIYQQIIEDLTDSQQNIDVSYLSGQLTPTSTERLRPNKAAVTALLARVLLYQERWEEAEAESSKLIGDSNFKLEPLAETFLMSSKEAIWQLQPISTFDNTYEASANVLLPGTFYPPGPSTDAYGRGAYLSKSLFDSFEKDDDRKKIWIDSVTVNDGNLSRTYPFAYKYKAFDYGAPRTEYLIILRLSEQFLIRAEARAEQGKLTGPGGAIEDLDQVRSRAGLPAALATSKENVLDAIQKERRSELFCEFGHRWFDLKRTGMIDKVMILEASKKNSSWATFKGLYPIPPSDISKNPNLVGHQNPGYPER